MGSKTAQKMLDALIDETNRLVHAVGAVKSCKDRHESLLEKMVKENNIANWNKLQAEYQKNSAELVKKWKEWPKIWSSAKAKANEIDAYCDENKKKHKMRPLLGRDLDKIKKKVDEWRDHMDYCVQEIKVFQPVYESMKKEKIVVLDENYSDFAEVMGRGK